MLKIAQTQTASVAHPNAASLHSNAIVSRESQRTVAPRQEIRCKAGGGGGQAWEKTGRLRDLGRHSLWHGKEPRGVEVRGELSALDEITFLQSPELEQEYRGGGKQC